MKGVTIEEYKRFLNFVLERVPELKKYNINIKSGRFSMYQVDKKNVYIEVEENLDKEFDNFLKKYLPKFVNKDIYWFNFFVNEYFCFLHELGHIFDYDKDSDIVSHNMYKEHKEKIYNNYEAAYTFYRNIPVEKKADQFAIQFINEYFYEIGKFFNPKETEESLKLFLGVF